ncbi:ABC transporter ATP-binding protein [Mesorhizobium sp.]|uniref:ABC transporter ATP-binding protein n=1 Tax=Mesorhizobium sp. TaxID=1871066 RepID=UPI0025BD394E|nr:ABC transporter ATP-binding protein [Mesorhizobium sp.]
MPGASDVVVEMTGIQKQFGDLVAIEDATLVVQKGEIHALVGENGAGKSTLMNILYGLITRSAGEIKLKGLPVEFTNPADAIQAGIGMVHQHFKLSPSFTVAENIVIGAEPLKSYGRVDFKKAQRDTLELSRRFGLELDPTAIVAKLPVGLRQRVEILKALYRKAEILILDEPTAVLTPNETRELFKTMRSLAESGCSIIFISHKLREVLEVADRVSVMRRGRIRKTFQAAGVTAQDIANEMVGRSVLLKVEKTPSTFDGQKLLSVKDLESYGDRGEVAVDSLSMDVRAGEIVGLAGVQGNGQDELVQCIAGMRKPANGMIAFGDKVVHTSPRAARAAGLAYIPADRGGVGLSLQSSIWENMMVGHFSEVTRGPFISSAAAKAQAQRLVDAYDVRGGGIHAAAGSLSGGNQQKVQIARELSRQANVVVAEQPSQGVDIGAIESIHRLLVSMRDSGKAVLVVSADLDEIMALSDRILVMYRGRIVADLLTSETSYEEVGRYMGGLIASGQPAPGTADRSLADPV